MSRMHKLLAVAILLAGFATPARADFLVTGTLTGAQEVPPNLSPAIGSFLGMLNDDLTSLVYTVTYSGLIGTGPVSGAHFHQAPPGVNGAIVHGENQALFTFPNGIFSDSWNSTDAQPLTPALAQALLDGNIYFNIHNAPQFPGGQIRAQLTAEQVIPEPTAFALLGIGAVGLIGYGWRRRSRK